MSLMPLFQYVLEIIILFQQIQYICNTKRHLCIKQQNIGKLQVISQLEALLSGRLPGLDLTFFVTSRLCLSTGRMGRFRYFFSRFRPICRVALPLWLHILQHASRFHGLRIYTSDTGCSPGSISRNLLYQQPAFYDLSDGIFRPDVFLVCAYEVRMLDEAFPPVHFDFVHRFLEVVAVIHQSEMFP